MLLFSALSELLVMAKASAVFQTLYTATEDRRSPKGMLAIPYLLYTGHGPEQSMLTGG